MPVTEPSLTTQLYYAACIILWLGLTALAIMAGRRDFPLFLAARPRLMVLLLGTNRMPSRPLRTLRRFYWFLDGGWTWLLVWSWWLMPWVRDFFYRSTPNPTAFHIARISSIIIVLLYAIVGFFAIGRAITIWFREIYNPARPKTSG